MTLRQSHDGTAPLPDWEPELEFVDDPAENKPDAAIEDPPDNEDDPEYRDDGDAETWGDERDRSHDPSEEPNEP